LYLRLFSMHFSAKKVHFAHATTQIICQSWPFIISFAT